jgi:hypothetical protein
MRLEMEAPCSLLDPQNKLLLKEDYLISSHQRSITKISI